MPLFDLNNPVFFFYRFEDTPDFPVTFPDTWIRLKRTGNRLTGYTGTDGKSWKEYASFTLDLPEKVYLGPAVTSHNTTESATAKFRNTGEYPKVLRRYGMKALRQSSGELAELSWQAVRTLAENCQGLTGLPFPSADRTLRTIDYIYDIF